MSLLPEIVVSFSSCQGPTGSERQAALGKRGNLHTGRGKNNLHQASLTCDDNLIFPERYFWKPRIDIDSWKGTLRSSKETKKEVRISFRILIL